MSSKMLGWFRVGSHSHNGHDYHGDGPHGHRHGVIDPTIATTERGIWAIKWSFVIFATTAFLQVFVAISGSVALLADVAATVVIRRPGGVEETLDLTPVAGDRKLLKSSVAPAEPHAFDAELRLVANGMAKTVPFRMVEPHAHEH